MKKVEITRELYKQNTLFTNDYNKVSEYINEQAINGVDTIIYCSLDKAVKHQLIEDGYTVEDSLSGGVKITWF